MLNEEFHRAGLPRVLRGMGEALVGPSVIVHGTPEQRAHFLPRIISGADVYCQGFSEPGHGSDLAAVETRGVVDGDEIVVTGQKVWTSGASRATMMFVLCRTDPDAEKHAGLSYVLIPFTGPGVEYRPIRQMSGASEFCEDFLDGVRAPLFNVIGGLNNGWRVAMTTLGHERGGRATVQHLGFEREFWELADTARKYGKDRRSPGPPAARPGLHRRAAHAVQRAAHPGRDGRGPPARPGGVGGQAVLERVPQAARRDRDGDHGRRRAAAPEGAGYPTTGWQNVFLSSRAGTIYSGTSEIQRTIIGERGLGLPKEPGVASRRARPSGLRAREPAQERRGGAVRDGERGPGRRSAGLLRCQPPTRPDRPLVTPDRLSEFFAPRSIAVVGASDTSGWARFVAASCRAAGFSGPLIPVHPVHGPSSAARPYAASATSPNRRTWRSSWCPTEAVETVLDDAGAAGVRNAVVLAAGYRELGEPGRALEQQMIARAAAHGITVLGPNCLGFLNAHARAAPFALTVPPPLLAGPVGIALQSGALASVVLAFAHAHAIGVSTLATMGNEAMIGATDMLEYLIEDDATGVICLFLEQISDPARFARAAQRADRAGKPIVVLKAGASPAGQQVALAHTGVGGRRRRGGRRGAAPAQRDPRDQHRGTAVHRRAARLRPVARGPAHGRGDRLRAAPATSSPTARPRRGSRSPSSRRETAAAIEPLVPPFAAVRNPLDVTGYFLANRRTSALTAVDHALDAAVTDPGLDFVLFTGLNLPQAGRTTRRPPPRSRSAPPGSASASPPPRYRSSRPPTPAWTSASTAGRCWTRRGIHMLRRHRPRPDRARPCPALAGEPGPSARRGHPGRVTAGCRRRRALVRGGRAGPARRIRRPGRARRAGRLGRRRGGRGAAARASRSC